MDGSPPWGTHRALARSRGATLALAVVLLVAGIAWSGAASAAIPADRVAERLERRLGARAQAQVHRATGRVRFVGTPARRPLARPGGISATAPARTVARAFLAEHGAAFGVRDAAGELTVERVIAGPRASRSVRLRQQHDGIPIVGGELIVNVEPDGRVLSAGGEVVPSRALEDVELAPRVPAADAAAAAGAAVARAHGMSRDELTVAPPQLEIYDPRLLGAPGAPGPRLVWRTEVTGGALGEIRELVLVDAQLGAVALRFNQVAHAKQRTVCDGGNVPAGAGVPCMTPVRSEGQPPVGSPADVDLAYDFAGDTYDFFADRFGRDSIDGRGMPLRSTVRYCDPEEACPYRNAFWNGQQMVYGAGFAADDVVGHELAHGFTEYTSGLFYYFQSGAINESLSDVFGELIDLVNGAGTDTQAVRWLMGEDIPVIGALRDMSDPPTFRDPDRMSSQWYFDGEDARGNDADNGGVHINSGVGNKAAYLLTDGDTFNGETVSGLGVDKVAWLYYTVATTLLTSGSDYADLAVALQQACASLVGSRGFVAADCDQVDAAVRAVEMDVDPPRAPAPKSLVCAPGDVATDVYHEDFEDLDRVEWEVQALEGAPAWYHSHPNPQMTYARSGTGNLWGYDRAGLGDYAAAMATDVVVPPNAWMRFEHAFGFEDDADHAHDGGVLEYSLDGGGSWADAGPLIADQGYTGTIDSNVANPLQGRSGFVRESNGYRATRLNLTALAGQSIRFRFRIGTNESPDTDDYGWFIDTVRIYGCEENHDHDPPDTVLTFGPSGPIADDAPVFAFGSGDPDATFECRLDGARFVPCASPRRFTSLDDGQHTFQVRARDVAGNADPDPPSRTFTVDTTPPRTTIIGGPNGPVDDSSPVFAFVADEAGATFECRLNGGAFTSCRSPVALVQLAIGGYFFEVRARDLVGNVEPVPAARSFTVVNPPPPSIVDPPPAVPPSRRPATASARATVVSKRALVRRGHVRLVVRCRARGVARCRGPLRLGPRGRFGRRTVNVRAGRRAAVVVRLTRAGKRALARRGRLRAPVLVRTRVPGSANTTHRARVLLILRA